MAAIDELRTEVRYARDMEIKLHEGYLQAVEYRVRMEVTLDLAMAEGEDDDE